ncbi:transcription factor bHLH110 isoform X2 [Cajanus cajan]|nr:transcription factor bHLH110 isoform X2 [Cajanus cajan]
MGSSSFKITMDFASFHLQHQLQEESAQCLITSSTPPHDSKPSTDITSQSWIPSNMFNGCNSGFPTENFTNSRELQHKHATTDSSLRISTRQAFSFHHGKSLTQQPDSDLVPARIKGEMINTMEESSLVPIHEPRYSPSFLSSLRVTGEEFFLAENNAYHDDKPIDGGTLSKRYNNFGDVSLNWNLPTLDMTSSLVSCSLGLNPKMLDLHTSNHALQPCYNTFGLNESMSLSYGDMHGRENSSSNSSNKISSFTREVAMTKRPGNCSLPKESEAKAKKSRPSCPPLKVRKEKLGDRIQTLQRLVAPFGKTSTASVLSEAIGYIHFLHQQVQTLSIPYMKSVQTKPSRMVQLDSNSRELKPDLRSRGLCLVPLSYASFVHRCV